MAKHDKVPNLPSKPAAPLGPGKVEHDALTKEPLDDSEGKPIPSVGEAVRQQYPNACCVEGAFGDRTLHRIEDRSNGKRHQSLSDWHDTPKDAWADADARLKTSK